YVTVSNAVNVTLYDKLSFDLMRDLVPIASITRSPEVLEVNPSFPAQTLPEFIAYAKANPGKINMASAGPGSAPHLYTELFKMMTGVDVWGCCASWVARRLRGPGGMSRPRARAAPSHQRRGSCQVRPDRLVDHPIRAGKVRPLAVTTATRLEVLPDVPTVGDFVPGYEASGWYGLAAPKNTPAQIVDKLNTEINAALADPRMRALFADLGGTVLPGSPACFAKLLAPG